MDQRLMVYGAPGCEEHFRRMANLSLAANVYRFADQEGYQKWRMRLQTPQGESEALRRRIQRYQWTRNTELQQLKTEGNTEHIPWETLHRAVEETRKKARYDSDEEEKAQEGIKEKEPRTMQNANLCNLIYRENQRGAPTKSPNTPNVK